MKVSSVLKAMLNPSSTGVSLSTRLGRPAIGTLAGSQKYLRVRGRLGFCTSISWSSSNGGLGRRDVFMWEGGHFKIREFTCNQCRIYAGMETEISTNIIWQLPRKDSIFGTRTLWISTPLQMGRRSAKIATKKGAQDKKKAKLYGKIGKQLVAAVKEGGANVISNPALAALLQTAKDCNIPKDIIERNIKKASDKNQEDFEELTYEIYGFGGVGIVLEVLTDNNKRAAASIRDVVKKSGGKMAEKGSVLFNFKRTGVISVKPSNFSGDEVLLAAMDAGAEDVIEPSTNEEEDDEVGEKSFKVLTPVDQYGTVIRKLKEAGLPVDTDNSTLELFPVATVKPDDEAEELNRVLMEKLLDLDDVDAVSSTQG